MERRTRSMERPGVPQKEGLEGLERLTNALERMLVNQEAQRNPEPPVPRETFQAPEYDGNGDVEAFIRQFNDVAVANDWGARSALLHIRGRLKEQAKECGHGHTLQAVFNTLRARFGMTPKEARSELQGLRKETHTTLFEHAARIERLTSIAFEELSDRMKEEMAVDTFCGSLGNIYLQRHLLAVPTPTLEAAVRAGNEYLQIRPEMTIRQNHPARYGVRAVQPDELEQAMEEQAEVEQAVVVRAAPDSLGLLLSTMEDLKKEMADLKRQVGHSQGPPQQVTRKKGVRRCWGCDQTGHWRRNCPKNQPSSRTTQGQNQGNAYRPQQ